MNEQRVYEDLLKDIMYNISIKNNKKTEILIKKLVEEYEVENIEDLHIQNIFKHAVTNGNSKAIRIGLSYNLNPNNTSTEYSHGSPLFFALHRNSLKMAKLLILNGAKVNISEKNSNTPLSLLLTSDYNHNHLLWKQILTMMLKRGADVNMVEPKNGLTPILRAVEKCRHITKNDYDFIKLINVVDKLIYLNEKYDVHINIHKKGKDGRDIKTIFEGVLNSKSDRNVVFHGYFNKLSEKIREFLVSIEKKEINNHLKTGLPKKESGVKNRI